MKARIELILMLAIAMAFAGCAPGTSEINEEARDYACHLFVPTESVPILTEWNVSQVKCKGYHIIEEIDSAGRVVEIIFMNNDKLWIPDAYNPVIVKYSYNENFITETLYTNDNEEFGASIGEPFRTQYYIEDGHILSCTREYLTEDDVNDMVDDFVYKVCSYIPSYLYSSAKMNGINPSYEEFDWSTVRLPYGINIMECGDD